jgi:carbamoyltransferase
VARILGISAHYHEAAAALVIDGKVVAALAEERLSRVKNDARLPFRAAHKCLELGQLRAQDLDEVVFYEDPFERLERVLVTSLRDYPRGAAGLPGIFRSQWGSRIWVLDLLAEGLGVSRRVVTHRRHHHCHAASAFFLSSFERAAVLTVDGVGEGMTTGLFLGEGNALTFEECLTFPHSLGLLYAAFTAYLGFEVNEGEHQVMGLSAFGKPRYLEKFARVVRSFPDGSFELVPEFFNFQGDASALYSSRLEGVFGPSRAYKREFGPFGEDGFEDPDSQRFADIAASLQATLERVLLGLCRRLRTKTESSHLCLAGGVALNALANARIFREAGFQDIFVQPAAGDAGGAMGAAILGSLEHGDPRPAPLDSAALGVPLDEHRAVELAEALGLLVEPCEDIAGAAVKQLQSGNIIAWAQGRSEWGPRALGQRSILCRADLPSLRTRLTDAIKKRETFRPFAPVTLESEAPRYFEYRKNSMTPFMTTVCQVRDPELALVTHVDGSARLQTVKEGNPLEPVLSQMSSKGNKPVLLNTSLNGSGEPLATTEGDVLGLFSRTNIDALFLERYLIRRPTR